MHTLILLIAFLIWIGLAIIAGREAEKKGKSYAEYFLICALLSPLIAGILLKRLPDKEGTVDIEEEKTRMEQEKTHKEEIKALAQKFLQAIISGDDPSNYILSDTVMGAFTGKTVKDYKIKDITPKFISCYLDYIDEKGNAINKICIIFIEDGLIKQIKL